MEHISLLHRSVSAVIWALPFCPSPFLPHISAAYFLVRHAGCTSFVCMVGNISIFIDDYFRMVLHLFSENHFYTIFQYLLQTRHSLKFTCNRNHLLQLFQSNKLPFNHLPAFRQQVSLLWKNSRNDLRPTRFFLNGEPKLHSIKIMPIPIAF